LLVILFALSPLFNITHIKNIVTTFIKLSFTLRSADTTETCAWLLHLVISLYARTRFGTSIQVVKLVEMVEKVATCNPEGLQV